MNTSTLNRLSNSLDNLVTFFLKHIFWIYVMIIWGISIIFTTESSEQNWLIFAPVFGILIIIFLPVLLFSFFRNDLKKHLSIASFNIVSIIVLIGYPLFLVLSDIATIINNTGIFRFDESVQHDVDNDLYLLISLAFFFVELALKLRSNIKYDLRFIHWMRKLTLEQALLIIISLFATLLGLIELSENQSGIQSFGQLPLFLTQWLFISLQFFLIILTYYTFYWTNHYILINKVLKPNGVLAYIMGFIFVVLIGSPIAAQVTLWITSIKFFEVNLTINEGAFDDMFFAFPLMEMLISIPFIVAIQWFRQTTKIATLEKAKSETELSLLKQQINPHFFFNTLNNLYALSLKKDEATPEVILQLSELMRYVIYKGKEEAVKLGDEVKYIEDYCELQQIRLYKNLDFRFTQNIEDETLQIPPLLFIILVENAFKHGIEPAENTCYLHINLESNENSLTFTCENSYEAESHKPRGIGLDNLQKRLELRYPNQHSLEILDDGNIYKTKLRLIIDG